jgi:hypothetical protein
MSTAVMRPSTDQAHPLNGMSAIDRLAADECVCGIKV